MAGWVQNQCWLEARLRTWKILGRGLSADDSRLLPLSFENVLRLCLCRGCGMTAAVPDGVSWTWMRTVRGQGLPATAACPLPIPARGLAAFVVVSDSYRLAVCRINRDSFADVETFGTKG